MQNSEKSLKNAQFFKNIVHFLFTEFFSYDKLSLGDKYGTNES